MSSGKMHFVYAIIAILIFIVAYFYFFDPTLFNQIKDNPILTLLLIIIFAVFAMMPDMDTWNSLIARWVLGGMILLALIFQILFLVYQKDINFIYYTIAILVILLFLRTRKHRGKHSLHSAIYGFIIPIPLFFINPLFYVAGVLGFMFHLLID